MSRPAVDIVVPFVGTDDELLKLLCAFRVLRTSSEDTLTVVDNRPALPPEPPSHPEVLHAPERQSSYFARNRGAARGSAPWIVFLDADVEPAPDLLDHYLQPPPAPDTGLLAGFVEPVLPPGGGHVARYGVLTGQLSSDGVSTPGFEYALTANVAVRREAFAALGGFTETVRSGGDADFSFRLRKAGWKIERRDGARVRHPTRGSLLALLRVFARYGAGTQWLRERYPDFSPPAPLLRLLASAAIAGARVPLLAARGRHDEALRRALDPAVGLAFEVGRFFPNQHHVKWGDRVHAARGAARDRWSPRRDGASSSLDTSANAAGEPGATDTA